jgi:hypothetical protein
LSYLKWNLTFHFRDVVKAFQLLDNKDTNDKIEAPEGIEDNAG